MVETILVLLNSEQLKRAVNQDSATTANRDTFRLLGETAGRVRLKTSVGRTGLAVTDKDIANYVLDEFTTVHQLSAADVAAMDDAAAKRAVQKKHRRTSNPDELCRVALARESSRPNTGGASVVGASSDAVVDAVIAPATDSRGASPTDFADSDRLITSDKAAAIVDGPLAPDDRFAVSSPREPSRALAFRKGRRALARLVTATARLTSDAAGRHVQHSADLLRSIAPALSTSQAQAVLKLAGENSGWDLDALDIEQAISFPSGVRHARHAHAAAMGRGVAARSDKASADLDMGLVAAAARADSSIIGSVVCDAAVGCPGSGGDDGLAGVPRLALPFVGTLLLRRHGFIRSRGEEGSPRASLPSMGGLGAVSLSSRADTAPGIPAAAVTASPAAAPPQATPEPPQADLTLDEGTVIRFLRRLSDGYRSNPYHNATHALDVMHSAHSIALSPHLLGVITREHKLAMLLGAALHDFRHDGLNNALHTKLRSPLALRYNDQSVLENMHVAEAYALMANDDEDLDVIAELGYETGVAVRQAVVQMVLATDMRFHFQALEDFEVNVLPIVRSYHEQAVAVMSEARAHRHRQEQGQEAQDYDGESPRDADATLGAGSSVMLERTHDRGGVWLSYASEHTVSDTTSVKPPPRRETSDSPRGPEDRRLSPKEGARSINSSSFIHVESRYHFGGAVGAVPGQRRARLSVVSAPVAELQAHSMVIAKLAMHAADVSNPVKELVTYRKWAARCMAEFYHIGDAEKAAGLTPSTLFDREARNMPKCQVGFISFIVRPLFAALSELVTDHAANWKRALDTNQAYFEQALTDGMTDDAPVPGDWFEDDPSIPRDGAMVDSPFLSLL